MGLRRVYSVRAPTGVGFGRLFTPRPPSPSQPFEGNQEHEQKVAEPFWTPNGSCPSVRDAGGRGARRGLGTYEAAEPEAAAGPRAGLGRGGFCLRRDHLRCRKWAEKRVL